MNHIVVIMMYTIKEAFKRKIVYVYGGLLALGLLLYYFSTSFSGNSPQGAGMPSNTQATVMQTMGGFFATKALSVFGSFLSLLVFFSTLTIYPLLFAKNEAEMMLTKPMRRGNFVLGRILGGVSFAFFSACIFTFGIFIITGVRFSVWEAQLFLFPLSAVVGISSIFAGVGVVASLTNSPIAGLVISYALFFIPPVKDLLVAIKSIKPFAEIIAAVVPNISVFFSKWPGELTSANLQLPWQQLVIASLFIIINIALTILIFEKKDL